MSYPHGNQQPKDNDSFVLGHKEGEKEAQLQGVQEG